MADMPRQPEPGNKLQTYRPTRTTAVLALGFFLSTGLFAVLIAYGLDRLQLSQENVQDVVINQNVKTDLITKMHDAARNRSLVLYRMTILDDPFERDELFLEFNKLAARFVASRTSLLGMELTEKENNILDEQGALTRIAVPLQNRVVDLVQNDEITAARLLLSDEAMPAQNHVMAKLDELQQYQRQSTKQATSYTERLQQRARKLILILGFLAIALSIVIAVYIIRRIMRTEHGLFLQKEQAELTLHSIGDAVITTNRDGHIYMMNPRAEDLTGYNSADVKGEPLNQVFRVLHEVNHEVIPDPIVEVLNSGEIVKSTQTEILISRDNHQYAIEHTVAPIKDIDGKVLGAILIFRDETENRALATKLSYQASHDMLTGLVNRREFESRLENCLSFVMNEAIPYSVCYLDLDQFKIINDTCGHNAGDELLRQVTHILKQQIRKSDTLARLGGDEFGVLLESCHIDKATTIANALLAAINDFHFTWEGKVFDVSASIGIAPITPATANIAEVLSAADSACYVAKDKGRNRVHAYRPDDMELERHMGEMQWVTRINSALENDRFVLYYQPITCLNETGAKMKHEILLRMLDEGNEIIPPMAFIPSAERYNLMPMIDRWVVKNSFTQIMGSEKCNQSGHIFTINISGQSLAASGFTEYVTEQLESSGINPGMVCIEITETAAIANMADAINFIESLKERGCHFSLDDFGSGLSSFSYLKNLPVDYIKIDGCFVRDICVDKTDRAFVESISQIGHVMHIKTIAEYVENQDILDELYKIGVDYAQGFHLAMPAPLSSFNQTSTPG